MEDIKFNFQFCLEVEERNGTKLIGSECEPVKLSHKCEDDVWYNGPTTYCRTNHSEFWFISQNNKPLIIEKYYQTGDWVESGSTGWNGFECPVLPNGSGIIRIEGN